MITPFQMLVKKFFPTHLFLLRILTSCSSIYTNKELEVCRRLDLICKLPFFAWCFIAVMFFSVLFVAYKLFKGKDIKSKIFSATEKQTVAADARELMDNQIRTGSFHINAIRRMIRDAFVSIYPDHTELEYEYIDLLTKSITDNLLQHFQIDLVRNHIMKKTDVELKSYTEGKASGYYEKVKTYLDDYNKAIKKYDFSAIMDLISNDDFYELYLNAYSGAKKIATGY